MCVWNLSLHVRTAVFCGLFKSGLLRIFHAPKASPRFVHLPRILVSPFIIQLTLVPLNITLTGLLM